mmetsp:Transcript_84366/g.103398  ORF Transcript_84366/g.103398 Transcript_84366/m.103398 type:complete len:230 (-) Transcript_84366:138-827(-)
MPEPCCDFKAMLLKVLALKGCQSVLGDLMRLDFTLGRRPYCAIQPCGHALLHALLQCLSSSSVLHVGKPHLQANHTCSSGTRQFVHKSNSRDHVGWLNGGSNHTKNQIVPVFIHLSAADSRLQLKLKVTTIGVHLILPLWTNVFPKDHDGINNVQSIRLLSHHPFLLKEFRGLWHVVPELPEFLHCRKCRNLVRGIRICCCFVIGHDLLPNGPCVSQRQILLEHLLIFR